MSAFDPGQAPCCDDCRQATRADCNYGGVGCGTYHEATDLLALAFECAEIIARIPDAQKRRQIAAYTADAWADAFEDGEWFEAAEFLAACGVHREKVLT